MLYAKTIYTYFPICMFLGGGKVRTLQEFYEERKRKALVFPPMVYSFSKPKYRQPFTEKEQETLSKFIRQVYNSRIKKLKEADYFKEEFMEPETGAYA